MATTSLETITNASNADVICDQLLSEAGLHPRWEPEFGMANGVYDKANLLLSAAHETELSPSQYEAAKALGQIFSFAANSKFQRAGPAFRAHTAIERRTGNCMAYLEVASAIMKKAGIDSYGAWSGTEVTGTHGNHAESGFVIANTVVEVDGYFGKSHVRRDLCDPTLHEAVKLATEEVRAVIVDVDHDTVVEIQDELPLDKLHTVNFRDTQKERIYPRILLPSAAAILMFSSVAVMETDNPKYANAKEVLRDYAPVL